MCNKCGSVSTVRSVTKPRPVQDHPASDGLVQAKAPLAQWLERWSYEPQVAGSSPAGSTFSKCVFCQKREEAVRNV